MLNVRDLEQRWLQYKIKSYYPYLFSLLGILLLTISITLYNTKEEPKKTATTPKKKSENRQIHVNTQPTVLANTTSVTQVPTVIPSQSKEPEPKSVAIKVNPERTTSNTYTPKKLEPSFSFLDKINTQPKSITPRETKKRQTVNTTITPAIEQEAPKIKEVKQKAKVTPKVQEQNQTPVGIKIDRAKTHKEIQDIIHRFKKNKNPALGLYLARYNYKIKNYQKSYNYALTTNHLDSNIEESWLIFASSQVKLGKKDAAVKTLIAYIKNSDSLNAKSLLRSIRNGEFQ